MAINLNLDKLSLDSALDAIFRTTQDGRIEYANEAASRHLGYSKDELLALSIPDINPDVTIDIWNITWKNLEHSGWRRFETRHKRKDGEIIPVEIVSSHIQYDNQSYMFSSVRDITSWKRTEAEIHSLAFYDTLTGLANRRLLYDRFSLVLSASERHKLYGAILFLDMDNFKTLNDTMGHDCGDKLLVEVAIRLKSCVREVDTIARFGGDEFVVLLEDVSENTENAAQKIAHIAEKIRESLAMPYELNGTVHISSPSIGVCLFYGNNASVEDLIKRADIAMYQAKNSGRNRVSFFSDPV